MRKRTAPTSCSSKSNLCSIRSGAIRVSKRWSKRSSARKNERSQFLGSTRPHVLVWRLGKNDDDLSPGALIGVAGKKAVCDGARDGSAVTDRRYRGPTPQRGVLTTKKL